MICKFCNKEIKNNRCLVFHIKKIHKISELEYYNTFIKKENEEICKFCGKDTKFINLKFGYKQLCPKCALLRTLKWYIFEYGEEEGTKRYKKHCKNNGNTKIENFIQKYGEEEGTKRYKNKVNKCKNTKKIFIDRHGEEEGNKKWIKYSLNLAELSRKRCSSLGQSTTKEYLIQKYGEEEGIRKYKEINKKKGLNLSYLIQKYGEEEGTKRYKDRCKKCSRTLNFFKNKYGKNEGEIKYLNWKKKISVVLGKASKESLEFFYPIIDWVFENNYCDFKDIYLGIPERQEWFISIHKQIFFYDFCIPKFNLIIEYNGEFWHPNPIWLKTDLNKWENWKNPINNKESLEVFLRDFKKLKISIENKFKTFSIYSSDNFEIEFIKIKKYILRFINNEFKS